MDVRTRRTFPARLVAAATLTTILAAPLASQAPSSLPPAKDLIAKFVAATNATAVMAKHPWRKGA